MRSFALILRTAALGLALLAAGTAHAHRPIEWRFIDLGVLSEGGQSFAVGVNNRGEIAGYASSPSGAMHGVIWENGEMRDIGVPPGTSEFFANGINASGRVVGISFGSEGITWKDGVWTGLGFLGEAKAINRRGDIAGSQVVGPHERAVLLRDDVLTDLGTLGGLASRANALNEYDHVVGQASLADGASHAFVWAHGRMHDLGSLGRRNSVATAINNWDVVVGFASDDSSQAAAFLWYGRTYRLLPGMTGVFPTAINDRNDIVGSLAEENMGFLIADGQLVRLDLLPAVLAADFRGLSPRAINDRRWIVGTAQAPTGGVHAFLLRPERHAR